MRRYYVDDERLVKAAISGDVQELGTCLFWREISCGAYYEALQYAVWNGHASFLKELLKLDVPSSLWHFRPRHADKGEEEEEEEGGWYFYGAQMMSSPFHVAVKEGHLEMVQQFLDFFHYNKVFDKWREISTSSIWKCKLWFEGLLEWAVRWGHHHALANSVLELLLITTPLLILPISGQLHALATNMALPVHVAAHYKHLDALKLLMEVEKRQTRSTHHNFHVERFSQDGLTTLHLAAQSGSSCTVEFLLTAYDHQKHSVEFVNERSKPDLFTALHMAANSGHVEVVSLLLQSFINRPAPADQADQQNSCKVHLLAQDRLGRTALHYAAREGHHHVVQLLLDCSTECDIAGIPDHDGLLPLHMAAGAGHVQVINILKRGYAGGINSVARHRLMMKHSFKNLFTIGLSFDQLGKRKFPRPNQIDSLFYKTEGFTPLHFAARYGHEAAVRELLDIDTEIKPNLQLRDHAGFLAFDWMEVQNKSELFLKCAMASQGPAVVDAIQKASCVRKMMRNKILRSNIAEDIDEEKKAMDEVQRAWESNTHPRLTMRVLQWLMEPDHKLLNEYLLSSEGEEGHMDVNDGTSALMWALSLKFRYRFANKILLALDPNVVLDHIVAKRVKEVLEQDMPYKVQLMQDVPYQVQLMQDKQRRDRTEFLIRLVIRYDKLAGASNLLRWMLPWAQKEEEDELVVAILDRPELKRGLYEDRQVYLDCANAILVGAALIGGVAFQAWLQPPMGYNYAYDGVNYAEVHQGPVRMFWRFNNAAFFFSVAALIAGAKGAVPVAHEEGIVESVEKVRRAVAVASTLLAVALVCVVVAFIEAGLAVLPPIPSDVEIMHTSACWGGIICSLALLWFSLSVWPLLLETVRYLLLVFVKPIPRFVKPIPRFVLFIRDFVHAIWNDRIEMLNNS